MTFDELKPLVEELSSEDKQRLRQYLEQLEISTEPRLQAGTMNVDELLLAIDDIRKDLSDEDVDEIIAAMNEEYIEDVDDTLWEI